MGPLRPRILRRLTTRVGVSWLPKAHGLTPTNELQHGSGVAVPPATTRDRPADSHRRPDSIVRVATLDVDGLSGIVVDGLCPVTW